MQVLSKKFRWFSVLSALLALVLTGCAHVPPARTQNDDVQAEADALRYGLTALAPTVQAEEAGRVVACAFDYSRQLALDYQLVRPPLFHNILVNTGLKRRGLCHEWADDLLIQLQSLNLTSLELHWAIARADTWREHNALVIAAVGQSFDQGIVLDPWRCSGRLVWSPVFADKYPWVEGRLEPSPEDIRP